MAGLHSYYSKIPQEKDLKQAVGIIYAVPHDLYLEKGWDLFSNIDKSETTLVFDIKGKLDREEVPENVILLRL